VNRFRRRFVLACMVGVAGCTSAPVRYYTLTAPPDKAVSAAEPAFAIEVRVVHTPPQLNRSELLVRTGPTEVTLLENERWAAPLNDEIQNALRLELQRRLGRMTGLRAASTRLRVDIDVQQLEAELGQSALLEASWNATLSAADPPSTRVRATACTFQADDKIHPGYAGMVEGYQRELAALADAIVAVLTSPAGGFDSPCR
jgi:uncharacterized protein